MKTLIRPATGWALLTAFLALPAGLDQALGGTPTFRDNLYYFMPQFEACRQAIAGGELPLWNPYMGCGHPLLATLQCSVFSPLSLPFMIFQFATAVKIFWLLAMLAASGGMFALALRAGLPPAGACLAGVLYSCAGPMRSLGEWPPIIQGMAFLPALLWAFQGLLKRERGGIPATAILGAVQILSGQPRQALIAGLACLLWWMAFQPSDERLSSTLKRVAGTALLATAMSAIQLFPSIELFHYSERGTHGVPPSTVSESFLSPKDLFTLVLSRFWGDEHHSFGPGRLLVPKLYIGWLGVLLAVSGAVHYRGRTHFFSLLAVFTGFTLALAGPFYGILFQSATESHSLRYMGHMVIPAFIGIALLAGSAVNNSGAIPGLQGKTAKAFLVSTAVIAALIAAPFAPSLLSLAGWPADVLESGSSLLAVRINAGMGAILLLLAWIFSKRLPRVPAVPALIPVILAIDLLSAFHGYTFRVDREFHTKPGLLDTGGITNGRIFAPSTAEQVYPDSSPIDMKDRYQARWNMASPNIPQIFLLRNAHGYEPFRLESQRKLFGGWESGKSPASPSLQATAVRWAVLPGHRREPGWTKKRALAGDWSLWEIPGSRALAEVIPATATEKDWLSLNNQSTTGTAQIRENGWNGLSATAFAQSGSVLLIRNSWYPGWKATVNGRRAPVRQAGGVFMAVPVPKGRSLVSLAYSPPSFWLGMLVSCSALAITLLAGLFAVFPRDTGPKSLK